MQKIAWIVFVCLVCIAGCSAAVYDKHWTLAEEYLRQGQHRKAIEEYSRVVNYGGRSAVAVQAQRQIAMIYEDHLKNYRYAIRAYRDVIARSEDRLVKVKARWAIARIYGMRLDRPQIAAQEYESLYREQGVTLKEGPEILFEWAQSLMDAGKFSDAASRYEEFRNRYPTHVEGARSLLLEGQAYLSDRNYGRAIEVFKILLEKYKNNSEHTTLLGEAWYGLGGSYEAKGEIDLSLEAYRESLSGYPNRAVVETKIERMIKRSKERKL